MIITPEFALPHFCENVTKFNLGCIRARKQFQPFPPEIRREIATGYLSVIVASMMQKSALSRPGSFKVSKLKIHRHFWTLNILPSTLDILPSTLDPRQKPTLILRYVEVTGVFVYVFATSSVGEEIEAFEPFLPAMCNGAEFTMRVERRNRRYVNRYGHGELGRSSSPMYCGRSSLTKRTILNMCSGISLSAPRA